MNIPLVDLKAQIEKIGPEIQTAMQEVIDSQAFIQGPFAQKFAEDFLKAHGGSYGVGCANGTSAITLVLRALGIGPGDEVLVPNNTFIGSVEPIVEVGAKPVLVETTEDHYHLDLEDLDRKRTANTKALIAVHLYGLSENIKTLQTWCCENGLSLVEDCAQAHLAKFESQAVGTFGVAGTFSFYPGKNLGAFGDAGFVLSEDKALIEKVKMLLDHGRKDKYLHEISAGNYRIDALQAAILSVKTKYIAEWSERRRQAAARYDLKLKEAGFKVLSPLPDSTPVYHLYLVEVSNRDEVMMTLKEKGIASGIHYPVTMNSQPAFSGYGYKSGQFPVSEKAAQRIMSLPIFPEITPEQIDLISETFLTVAKV